MNVKVSGDGANETDTVPTTEEEVELLAFILTNHQLP